MWPSPCPCWALAGAAMVQPCWRGSPKINASRTPGLLLLLPWITRPCPGSANILGTVWTASAPLLAMVGKGSVIPCHPPTRVHIGKQNPAVGHCPGARAAGTAMAQEVLLQAAPDTARGDISSSPAVWDASRSCCGGQLPGWEMLGFLSWLGAWWPSRELGALPGSPLAPVR